MSSLLLSAALVALAMLGATRLSRTSKAAAARRDFCASFLSRLTYFVEQLAADRIDHKSYGWLNRRSVRMQYYLGRVEELASDAAPSCTCVLGYQTVVNTVAGLKSFQRSDFRDIRRLDAAIARCLGAAEGTFEDATDKLRNPVIWLYEGIQAVLLFPLTVLAQLGVVRAAAVRRVGRSAPLQLAAFAVAAAGIFAAVYMVVLEWDQGISALRSHFLS